MNMARFFPLTPRVACAAFIAAAGLGLVLLWAFNRPGPLPLDHIASPAALTAKFEEIVFGNDFGPDSERVVKWGTSIKIVIATAIPDRLRQDLSDILSQARRLTGIDMRLAKKGGRNSIYVHYAPHAQFVPILRRFYPSRSKSLDWLRSASCFFSGIPRSYEYKWAVIGIADDLGEKETRSCIFEEIFQGLGPGKNSNALPPSISSIWDTQTELSLNDKIILRALYDPRITPGMARAQAMGIAREVIAGLVAAVKQKGEAALNHPRYRRRALDHRPVKP